MLQLRRSFATLVTVALAFSAGCGGTEPAPVSGVEEALRRHALGVIRLLIERQPTCLLRVGLDGVILAANNAALGQLGASHLGQALGQPVWKLLGGKARERLLMYVHAGGNSPQAYAQSWLQAKQFQALDDDPARWPFDLDPLARESVEPLSPVLQGRVHRGHLL